MLKGRESPKFDFHAITGSEHGRHLSDRRMIHLEVHFGSRLPEIDPLRVLRILLARVILRKPITDVDRGLGAQGPIDLRSPTKKLGRQLAVPSLTMVHREIYRGARRIGHGADSSAQCRGATVTNCREILP